MMRGLHSNRTRGRKARREGGGNQDNPRDEQPIRSELEHDEQFDRASSSTMKPLPEPAGGGLILKKQKRQGAVFRTGSPPKKVSVGYLRPLQPENSSYPHKRKAKRRVIVRPLSKGANGTINKRTNEMGTSARQRTRRSITPHISPRHDTRQIAC